MIRGKLHEHSQFIASSRHPGHKVTDNSYWDLILTEQGLVLKAKSGKYNGWFWDFGGGDPSHKEGDREVAINVLLAEKVVAGSYFEVKKK